MSKLVTIHGPDNAREARCGAAMEFIDVLHEYDRQSEVSSDQLHRWFTDKGPGPDLGPPVSPRLERQ